MKLKLILDSKEMLNHKKCNNKMPLNVTNLKVTKKHFIKNLKFIIYIKEAETSLYLQKQTVKIIM